MSGLATPTRTPRHSSILFLNSLIVVLVVIVGYLGYSFVQRHVLAPPVETTRQAANTREVIQMDVLNGCGVTGAAANVTAYLRARGYDVVEMRNYKTFDVSESLVIDRVGNLGTARKVAHALGVKEKNIIQQLNQDYYVDVSVVIGKDYAALKPSQ